MDISVVLPIYNEQAVIQESLHSLLSDSQLDMEIIVVNDGSSDDSQSLVELMAEDEPRIKVINQTNQGITKALIQGCNAASGKYIARHDAGDISFTDRLTRQFETLEASQNAVLCSVGTQYISHLGDPVYQVMQSSDQADAGLRPNKIDELSGPSHHGATMFRRDAYIQTGGYREQFVVAQDLDLWLRLAQCGKHITVPKVLYQACLRPNAISTEKRHLQEIARRAIYDCHAARLKKQSEQAIIEQFQQTANRVSKKSKRSDLEYNYFIGSMLLQSNSARSRYYFKEVLNTSPWHLKSLGKFLLSYLK